VADASRLYFAIGTRFHLGSLRAASDRLEVQSHWQKLAVAALIEEIYGHQLALASQVIDAGGKRKKAFNTDQAISAWIEENQISVERTDQLIVELSVTEINDLAMIAVASRQLRTLAETPAAR
jgi:glutamate dehydrogenase